MGSQPRLTGPADAMGSQPRLTGPVRSAEIITPAWACLLKAI
jgi:hypothetical protein